MHYNVVDTTTVSAKSRTRKAVPVGAAAAAAAAMTAELTKSRRLVADQNLRQRNCVFVELVVPFHVVFRVPDSPSSSLSSKNDDMKTGTEDLSMSGRCRLEDRNATVRSGRMSVECRPDGSGVTDEPAEADRTSPTTSSGITIDEHVLSDIECGTDETRSTLSTSDRHSENLSSVSVDEDNRDTDRFSCPTQQHRPIICDDTLFGTSSNQTTANEYDDITDDDSWYSTSSSEYSSSSEEDDDCQVNGQDDVGDDVETETETSAVTMISDRPKTPAPQRCSDISGQIASVSTTPPRLPFCWCRRPKSAGTRSINRLGKTGSCDRHSGSPVLTARASTTTTSCFCCLLNGFRPHPVDGFIQNGGATVASGCGGRKISLTNGSNSETDGSSCKLVLGELCHNRRQDSTGSFCFSLSKQPGCVELGRRGSIDLVRASSVQFAHADVCVDSSIADVGLATRTSVDVVRTLVERLGLSRPAPSTADTQPEVTRSTSVDITTATSPEKLSVQNSADGDRVSAVSETMARLREELRQLRFMDEAIAESLLKICARLHRYKLRHSIRHRDVIATVDHLLPQPQQTPHKIHHNNGTSSDPCSMYRTSTNHAIHRRFSVM